MKARQTAIREAMAQRERLAEIIEIVRAKADDPRDPEHIAAAEMIPQMERELAETDEGLRRIGMMQ